MFTTLSTLTWLAMSGCGLKGVLPGGPVLSRTELQRFGATTPSPAMYTGPSLVPFPVIPLQGFGLQYATDVVFVSRHPDWGMHEYAKLDLPDTSIWIAKDTARSGEQTIVADVEGLETWMPEIPAPRIQAPIQIQDQSHGDRIDITLRYENPLGQTTEIWAKGTMPAKAPMKRNGNTMGHSKDKVAAVLDLERFGSQIKGGIRIDGQEQKFDRVLGLVPFRFLLRQTQGGVVVSNFRQTPTPNGFLLTRPSPKSPDWPTRAQERWLWDGMTATHDNGVARFDYRFVGGGLSQITVRQHGLDTPTFELVMEPALPDLSRPFNGRHTVDFVMHVNGQRGHGLGTLTAYWDDATTVHVAFTPSTPHWLADRPMLSRIEFGVQGVVDQRTIRTGG